MFQRAQLRLLLESRFKRCKRFWSSRKSYVSFNDQSSKSMTRTPDADNEAHVIVLHSQKYIFKKNGKVDRQLILFFKACGLYKMFNGATFF